MHERVKGRPPQAARANNTQVTAWEAGKLAQIVRQGLASDPKRLPSALLYDEVGFALFEGICNLREYECTRAELRNLPYCAHLLSRLLHGALEIVELGGGSGEKMAVLLRSISPGNETIVCHDIDVSQTALSIYRQRQSVFDNVRVCLHACPFEQGLQQAAQKRSRGCPALFVLLGSSIGNFGYQTATGLLRSIRLAANAGDYLLLGMDLIKPLEKLIAAYDDPQGVTAAFNKNLLARINNELGANFDVRQFKHEARFNQSASAVEMHLCSMANQIVHIEGAELTVRFAQGESILTEQSHKYAPEHIEPWLRTVGFNTLRILVDESAQFADVIARAV